MYVLRHNVIERIGVKNKWPEMDPADIEWVLTQGQMLRMCSSIAEGAKEENTALVLDLETSGLDENAPTARTALGGFLLSSWDQPEKVKLWVVPFSHPHGPFAGKWHSTLAVIAEAIQNSGIPLVNQHLRFDLRWIYAATGIDLSGQMFWDTMLSSHLLDETWSTSLKDRAPVEFGIPSWADVDFAALEKDAAKEEKLTGQPARYLLSEREEMFKLGIYCARDVAYTWALAVRHRRRLEEAEEHTDEGRDLLRLGRYHRLIGVPTMRSITNMEQRGWLLDQDWTRARLAEFEDDVLASRSALDAMMSGSPDCYDTEVSYEPGSAWFGVWTQDMVRQGQLRVTASTPTGKPSWDKAVLLRQAREGSKAAEEVLAWRRGTKGAQFLRSWLKYVQVDGRIHSWYSYAKVSTGRTSCQFPNLQQVTKSLRPAFVADPGHTLVDADLSQIELRVIAHVAQCVPMIEAYREGADLHRMMGSQMTGKPLELVTDEERTKSKAVSFGFAYLQSPGGFIDYADATFGARFTREEAEAAQDAFFALWDGMKAWHVRVEREVARTETIWSPFGRARRFPGIQTYSNYDFSHAVRQAVNSPIQSMGSDILQMGVTKLRREYPWIQVLGMVHDSVVGSVPEDRAREACGALRRCMTSLDKEMLALGVRFAVPLEVDISVGPRWGEGVPFLG